MSSSAVHWSSTIKKEARESNNEDVDEVQEVGAKLCCSIESNDKQEILRSNRHRRKL
jgi:hypothetical protein